MALKRPRTSSLLVNQSRTPLPRKTSDCFTPYEPNPSPNRKGNRLLAPNVPKESRSNILDLLEESKGKRTIRLYGTFELYFTPTDKHKGKQFAIKQIRNDSIYGIEFKKTGVKPGWILTKIGHDEDAKKLLYSITKNRLLQLAKIAKKCGYQLTFEGSEIEPIAEEKQDADSNVNMDQIHIQNVNGNRVFIDDTDDLPMIPETNLATNQIDEDDALPMIPDL
eukprot:238046_1